MFQALNRKVGFVFFWFFHLFLLSFEQYLDSEPEILGHNCRLAGEPHANHP